MDKRSGNKGGAAFPGNHKDVHSPKLNFSEGGQGKIMVIKCRVIGYTKEYANTEPESDSCNPNPVLELRRTTSKGQATLGNPIWTLCVDGEKVASSMGGSDDQMIAVCLAKWAMRRFEKELAMLPFPSISGNGMRTVQYPGLSFCSRDHKRSSFLPFEGSIPCIDGTCGFPSVYAIMLACG